MNVIATIIIFIISLVGAAIVYSMTSQVWGGIAAGSVLAIVLTSIWQELK